MLNKSLAVFLIDENVRAIKVAFSDASKFYTYKTLDKTIKEGDFVLVLARNEYKAVKVVRVDVQDSLDFEDTSIEFGWIIQKIDKAAYDDVLAREELLKKSINSLVFKGKKEQMLAILKESNTDIKQLTF